MKIGLKKGFTLIELLIVIAIIGILAVALLPTVLGAPAKGRDAARKANLNAISTAIEGAMIDGVAYPNGGANGICANDTGLSTVKAYFQGGSAPLDPMGVNGPALAGCATRGSYLYGKASGSNGKNYWLAAYMEIAADANTTYAAMKTLAEKAEPAALATPTKCDAFSTTSPYNPVDTSCMFILVK